MGLCPPILYLFVTAPSYKDRVRLKTSQQNRKVDNFYTKVKYAT